MLNSIKITKEQKKILIIGGLLLVLGVVYRLYPLAYDFFSSADEMEFKKKTIEKYFQVIADGKEIERKKNQLSREINRIEVNLLKGDTPSLSAVEVQGIINDICQANNVKLQTMQVLSPEEATGLGYVAIPVQFAINSNILQLKEIIHRIESSPKLLIIKELNVERGDWGSGAEIRITMTVVGVMKGNLKEATPLNKPEKVKK